MKNLPKIIAGLLKLARDGVVIWLLVSIVSELSNQSALIAGIYLMLNKVLGGPTS